MSLKIEDFKRLDGYDTLFASFSVVFTNAAQGGLKIHNCTLRKNSKDGKYFVGFPVKAYKDEDGAEKYARHISFPYRDTLEQIQKQLVDQVKQLLGQHQEEIPF